MEPASPATSVDLVDRTGRLGPRASAWLLDHALAACRHLAVHGDIRVAVVDDVAMSRLHKDFGGTDGTTDVLTFDLSDRAIEPDRKECVNNTTGIDSDIVVCLDEALRHSIPGGYPVERELLLYVVHGVLHCLGHDDHDPGHAAAMHRAEDDILRAIGVGAVYAQEPGARPAEGQDGPTGRAGESGGPKG